MANICSFDGICELPKEKLKHFLAYFDWKDKEVSRHIRRTQFEIDYSEDMDAGMVRLEFYGSCAWSCLSCWSEVFDKDCISMLDVLKECDVKYFVGRSEELGVGFYEFFKYVKGYGELTINCFDLY